MLSAIFVVKITGDFTGVVETLSVDTLGRKGAPTPTSSSDGLSFSNSNSNSNDIMISFKIRQFHCLLSKIEV